MQIDRETTEAQVANAQNDKDDDAVVVRLVDFATEKIGPAHTACAVITGPAERGIARGGLNRNCCRRRIKAGVVHKGKFP